MPPVTIPPRSGTAFRLAAGEVLIVIDPQGCQVADMIAFNAHDVGEALSSGRTLDYQETIRLTTGDRLWSNRSRVMLEIVEDTVGLHDFLLTPCSREAFAICSGDHGAHTGCVGSLCAGLEP